MRVLWFTNTPSRYADFGGYNGGGWIYSLEEELSKRKDVELGIAFFMNKQPKKVLKNNVTYYPINNSFTGSIINKVKASLISRRYMEKEWLKSFLEVVHDYNPQIIEVFGSEQSFGQIAQYISIPVVLHIQGILTPIYNAFLPPFISLHNYLFEDMLPWHIYKRYRNITGFKYNAAREIGIIKSVHYFIGRTNWDKEIVKLYNSKAIYFYGGEILRDVFYKPLDRKTFKGKYVLVSTLSDPLYKGYDIVLKTAKLLKENNICNFEWHIFGNINPCFIERKIKIKHEDVNVLFKGVATPEVLSQELSKATAYLHLTYIDNSPNSVCEAQILGVPVIATNVGGIPSLVENGKTGFLVPSNDPFQAAAIIAKLVRDVELRKFIGQKASEVAVSRHNKPGIVDSLIKTYIKIINDTQNS